MLVQEFSFMFNQLKMIMFTVIQHSKENWINLAVKQQISTIYKNHTRLKWLFVFHLL